MTKKHIQVEGHKELVRDNGSKAIINKDIKAYINAKEARAKRLNDKERLDRVEEAVSDIQRMLRLLLDEKEITLDDSEE